MGNKLHDVVEVFCSSSEDEVNARLAAGWFLLETCTTCYEPSVPQLAKHQTIHYSVGRTGDVPPFAGSEWEHL